VRGPSLDSAMSQYLVRDIEAAPNIEVRLNTEIVRGRGDQRLRSLELRDRAANSTEEVPAAAVFVLIGAVPRTAWLPDDVRRDERGFVLTGAGLGAAAAAGDAPLAPFGTSLPGVFAVGDVRADSIKRVASSVGEGSSAIRLVHDYLVSWASDSAGRGLTRRGTL
jgi:thioredoxin reductase (NADPH)